jgi:hypothetical protein
MCRSFDGLRVGRRSARACADNHRDRDNGGNSSLIPSRRHSFLREPASFQQSQYTKK